LPDELVRKNGNKKYKNNASINLEEYTSKNTRQLDKKAILKLLDEDGWLDQEQNQPLSSIFSPYRD
jgi:hypothetical protein